MFVVQWRRYDFEIEVPTSSIPPSSRPAVPYLGSYALAPLSVNEIPMYT